MPRSTHGAARANWWALLADPGVPMPAPGTSSAQLVLGFPNGDFGGWGAFLGALGLPSASAELIVPIRNMMRERNGE